MNIGFQGIHGAYSEVGIFAHFGHGVETVGFDDFEDVFSALASQQIDFAFIPVENSIIGSIPANMDLLLREDVSIVGEVFLRVRHHLLGIKGASLPSVKTVHSHPAAIGQCKDFLRMNNLQARQAFDTAGAAQEIAQRNDPTAAAIASELCASIYNLDVLARDIQSYTDNQTRFFVVSRKQDAPPDVQREKTSLAFKTYHQSGALVAVLSMLSRHGINMTKLESRPDPTNPWQYTFFVDIEGGLYDPPVLKALAEIGSSTPFHKVLGSYPKGRQVG